MEQVLELRNRVLEILSGKLDGFYLAGGTALSLFYFQHRESFDLDFFTDQFNKVRIQKIAEYIKDSLKKPVDLAGENISDETAKMQAYYVPAEKKTSLKIDFVEDFFDLIKPLTVADGIPVLSLEDIYFRKILAIGGSFRQENSAGKEFFVGGRQEAKDFFDLYHLSTTFMPLSEFVQKYCDAIMTESIIVWHRSYDRITIRTGLIDIITSHVSDYREMERHFKKEIDAIIKEII